MAFGAHFFKPFSVPTIGPFEAALTQREIESGAFGDASANLYLMALDWIRDESRPEQERKDTYVRLYHSVVQFSPNERYDKTPPSRTLLTNLFTFANKVVDHFDADGDGALDQQEFFHAQGFTDTIWDAYEKCHEALVDDAVHDIRAWQTGGERKVEMEGRHMSQIKSRCVDQAKWFQTFYQDVLYEYLNVDGEDGLSSLEVANWWMLNDGAVYFLNRAEMDHYEKTRKIPVKKEYAEYIAFNWRFHPVYTPPWYQWYRKIPEKPDGQVTPTERKVVNEFAQHEPELLVWAIRDLFQWMKSAAEQAGIPISAA